MSLAFAAVFVVALIFTVYAFTTIEEDTQTKSVRTAYLLMIAIAAWTSSIFLLTNPIGITSYYPAYNIITPSGTVQMPNFQVSSQTNTPFPTSDGYEYMAFAGAMAIIESIFLLLFIMDKSVELILDTIKDILHPRR